MQLFSGPTSLKLLIILIFIYFIKFKRQTYNCKYCNKLDGWDNYSEILQINKMISYSLV